MINLIKNTKKRQKKRHLSQRINLEAFRPTKEVAGKLTEVYNKSLYINRAIYFYMLMRGNPIEVLKEIKKTNPKLYKFVGRKKFL